ncbi:RDD family protein [Haliea sp. E17]|uniref:RDD family protein n=1 Tax=Haliea sp. E17 TaxID=3401576 RepID=UPI003AAD6E03
MEDYTYAGFWIRLVAVLIDTLVLLLVLSIPLTLIYGKSYWLGEQMVHGTWDILLNYFLPIIATIWFWHRFAGTPGKMALRLKILDAKTGRPPSVQQSVLRYLGYFVSTIPLCLGFLWVGIDTRKRGFHDMIAGTVVVRDLSHDKVTFSEGS